MGGSPVFKKDPHDYSPWSPTLEKVSYFYLLLMAGVMLAQFAYMLFACLPAMYQKEPERARQLRSMILCTALALFPAAIRIVHSLVYAFHRSQGRNSISGSLVVRTVPVFLMQLLSVMVMTLGGVLSRGLTDKLGQRTPPTPEEQYEPVREPYRLR